MSHCVPRSPRGDRRGGQMLVIILWIMGLVSLAVGTLVMRSTHELRLSRIPLESLQRKAIAQAAVQRAIILLQHDDPAVDHLEEAWATGIDRQTDTPLLQDIAVGKGVFSVGVHDGDTFVPGLIDEERKLNLTTATAEQLRRLVAAVAPPDADPNIAEALITWRASCEGADPPCSSAMLQTVAELTLVPGLTPEMFSALEPYVTVYGSGAVNANTAPAVVLDALGCRGGDLVQRRRHAPFTEAPADCPGTRVTSSAFTVPVEAAVRHTSGVTRLRAVVMRDGNIRFWSPDQ